MYKNKTMDNVLSNVFYNYKYIYKFNIFFAFLQAVNLLKIQ